MNILKSEMHEIYGVKVTKTTLSPIDTKRWIADDGVNTRAFGFNPPLRDEFVNELIDEIFKV